jgi:hypothetical protein
LVTSIPGSKNARFEPISERRSVDRGGSLAEAVLGVDRATQAGDGPACLVAAVVAVLAMALPKALAALLLRRRSFTLGTPRGLFGSIGLMAAHSSSVSS